MLKVCKKIGDLRVVALVLKFILNRNYFCNISFYGASGKLILIALRKIGTTFALVLCINITNLLWVFSA